jgi:outer membrane receptor protein involved in Fe transport
MKAKQEQGVHMVRSFRGARRALGLTSLSAIVPFACGYAQENPAQESQSTLEEVVVTGIARPTERLESSVSTSSLNLDKMFEVAPRSVAEIFRALPGIRAESSGGNGNANITIRGIPLATGGAKYLQLHEDGLPVLEYGDINFANADNFIRYDGSIERIEAVRGGSASTFASNSPGGVINLISKTGTGDEGNVGLSYGVDYDELRTDFDYGGSLTDSMDFHIGGFYREGEGVRETGLDGDKGGQLKANLTKHFSRGYLRLYAKHLDDRVSTYLPAPVRVKGTGEFGPVANFDASSQSLYSGLQRSISTFDAFGASRRRDLSDGIESRVDAVGFEVDADLGAGFNLNNKFRISDIRGGFISPFTDGVGTAGALADAICAGSPSNGAGLPAAGCVGTTVTIANGSGAGSAYDRNALAFNNLIFDTQFNDVGLSVNDFKVSKDVGPATVTVGYYASNQEIDIDWSSWQFYLQTVDGTNPQNLNVVSTTGQRIVQDGLYFPGLLSWAWDLEYETRAPYLNVGFELDRVNLDLSVRRDDVEARGQRVAACCGVGTDGAGFVADMDGNGAIDFYEARGVAVANGAAPVNLVNYDAHNTSFSVGGTYLLNDTSSVFARYSEGGRAIADRMLQIAGTLNADGSLTSTTDGYDNVEQLEIGYKMRTGDLDLYVTFFDTSTEETNAEVTSGLTFVRDYEAHGLEVEGHWALGAFSVDGNVTWTDAEIASDRNNAAVVGNTPRRQADFIWTLTPQYSVDKWSVGTTLQGSTEYYTQDVNSLKQGAYTLVHLFGRYNVTQAFSVALNVNNLTDEFVVTEVEEGVAPVGAIVRGRPLSARSSSVSFRYRF